MQGSHHRAARIIAGTFILLALCLVALVAWTRTKNFQSTLLEIASKYVAHDISVDTLDVHLFSLHPEILATGLRIRNPPWIRNSAWAQDVQRIRSATRPVEELMADIASARVVFDWPNMFAGNRVRAVSLSGAKLFFLRDEQGRANWRRTDAKRGLGKGPPILQKLSIQDSQVWLWDARRHLQFAGSCSVGDDSQRQLQMVLTGRLNGRATQLHLRADPLASAQRGQPYRFEFRETSARAQLQGTGTILRPFDFRSLDVRFASHGEDLRDFYFLTGLTLPHSRNYHLRGLLERRGLQYDFRELEATSGQSDMHGSVHVDSSHDRPFLAYRLRSNTLRLADLNSRLDAPENAAIQTVFARGKAQLEGLRRIDGTIGFDAEKLMIGRSTLENVSMKAQLRGGVLELQGLNAAVWHGRLNASGRFDASGHAVRSRWSAAIDNAQVGELDPKRPPRITGLMSLRTSFSGNGTSVHDIAASANGAVSIELRRAAVSKTLADLAALHVGRALWSKWRDQPDLPVQCGRAQLTLRVGTANIDSLELIARPFGFTGEGALDLNDEKALLHGTTFEQTTRGMQPRASIGLRGPLLHPSVTISSRVASSAQPTCAAQPIKDVGNPAH